MIGSRYSRKQEKQKYMGTFVNLDNSAFQVALNSQIYVDKTGFIGEIKVLDTTDGYICKSRPRRFGKSITANMLSAYYSRGCAVKNQGEYWTQIYCHYR